MRRAEKCGASSGPIDSLSRNLNMTDLVVGTNSTIAEPFLFLMNPDSLQQRQNLEQLRQYDT